MMVRDAGSEPVIPTLNIKHLRGPTQIDAHFLRDNPEVCRIIRRWLQLDHRIKAAILALVAANSEEDRDAS